jgi:hypothetical protein
VPALQHRLVAALRARATGWPTPDLPTAYHHLATALQRAFQEEPNGAISAGWPAGAG